MFLDMIGVDNWDKDTIKNVKPFYKKAIWSVLNKMETVQERSKLLKRIVGKITYNREENNVYLGIQFFFNETLRRV